MADRIILTSGAKFKCAHMVQPVDGLVISLLSTKIRIGAEAAILDGATISGFTTDAGCTFSDSSGAKPCREFSLPSATGNLSEDGRKVYTTADLQEIKLASSSGNGLPGLEIFEPQSKVRA